jgi:2-polyprenyl-3-methyl-5-hydroxy-6-metoxy-1,4-benzoquinol methylase
MFACPLCHHPRPEDYHQDAARRYSICTRCQLVFADPLARLSASAEKQVYDQHQNCPDDPGYRRFLNKLAAPLVSRLSPGSHGLDFGCGPGPTLSVMLEEAGHRVETYDVFYAPDRQVLAQQYDFVTCSEAIEHFNQPAEEWQLLVSLLKPGGWLGVMTQMVISLERFARWHYKTDPTHVSFFSRDTFAYLAQRDRLKLEFIGKDVCLLQKT